LFAYWRRRSRHQSIFLFFKGIEIRRCGGLCLLLLRVSRWKKEEKKKGRTRERAVPIDRLMKHLVPAQLINAGKSRGKRRRRRKRKPVGTTEVLFFLSF
jgi:hypothetical protein